MGIIIGILVGVALIFRLVISKPVALGGILAVVLLIIMGRPYLLKKKEKTQQKGDKFLLVTLAAFTGDWRRCDGLFWCR